MGRPAYIEAPREVHEQAAWRYRWLTRWARLTAKPAALAQARDLATMDRLIDQHGLRGEADRFIQHLTDAKARSARP